ncbi:nitrate reductase molybdenum cofactor assembly chaperone [Thiothrix unzii]|uniref:Nitrate reductase molybdenum cofactor assembly chaperone n=1 Tax=Thiothrix unzii TaxID=111769 RepID=A0A975FCX5_9GAMM|nr:nitrate reductase molybdenum cofactor assembly chaperone [Thiothrix unzii]QTR54690.1 nitrate reductase molybdenum cofactor assembly chaperone [Thiothrix unzii]
MFYRLLARLLDYPTAELQSALPEIWAQLEKLPEGERKVVGNFLAHLHWEDMTEWQALYVRTFDMVPDNALHLSHHLFGDDKNRGPALIDLSEFYKEYGLELAANELPDYLPLMLEFSSQLEQDEAKMFLSQWVKVLGQLALNLEKVESPYAPLIRLIEQRSQLVTAKAA